MPVSLSAVLRPFAGFYFFYFAFVGVISPYWSVYLQSLGFDAMSIAWLASLSTFARLFAPSLWGWLADCFPHRRQALIRLACVAACLSFLLLALGKSFFLFFIALAFVHLFWAGALPLVEASTLALTAASPGQYSLVRLWGSVGFVVAALGLGYALDYFSSDLIAIAAFISLLFLALSSYFLVIPLRSQAPNALFPLRSILQQSAVKTLLMCSFLMAFAHGPYYIFLSLGLVKAGYSASAIGGLWSLGVICEIVVFWAMPKILRRYSLTQVLQSSLATAAIRFVMIAFLFENPLWMIVAQTLHALTFAAHHASAVGLIHRLFPEAHQSKAQGLYIAVSYGLGGTAGGLLAGVLWPHWGMAGAFLPSAFAALIAWWLARRSLSASV